MRGVFLAFHGCILWCSGALRRRLEQLQCSDVGIRASVLQKHCLKSAVAPQMGSFVALMITITVPCAMTVFHAHKPPFFSKIISEWPWPRHHLLTCWTKPYGAYVLEASRAARSHDGAVLQKCCRCLMGLYGVSDWHSHEVIKEEPACVALNKAPLSSVGHYMREALDSKAQLPRVLHFPSLTHCC